MRLTVEEGLFSVKCFAAAMLAFYVALSIGLPRPYWALTTAYVVSQPLAGAVLSKATFRFAGTLLGASAAVILVPNFVNEPFVLSAALALWLGLCTAVALLDRTPRGYVFLLAGYTASIIGFPSVDTPGAIFDVAILRVQEITIGIVASSLVHGVVFPRTVTARLLARATKILADAERSTALVLARVPMPGGVDDRRRIAIDLGELDQLAVQLPFDMAAQIPRSSTVRAFQDRLLEQLPLSGTVESRLAELAMTGGRPAEIERIADDTAKWLLAGAFAPDHDVSAEKLVSRLDTISAATGTAEWRDMLVLNLCARLADLIKIHRDARDLSSELRNPGMTSCLPSVGTASRLGRYRSLHRDPGLAMRAAAGTFVCVMLGCAFWIATAWTDGAGALLIASVCCSLFASVDRPAPVIFRYLVGASVGVVVAMVYAFAVLPRVTTFEMLVLTTSPALLTLGVCLAHPKLSFAAFGALVAFFSEAGFSASYSDDFATFANSSLALLVGVGFACVSTRIFQTIGAEASVLRVLRAGWRDVALRAEGRDLDERRWAGRMLDRIGLLVPRLALLETPVGGDFMDMLTDMRTGLVAGRLRRMVPRSSGSNDAPIEETLEGIARYFRTIKPKRPLPPPQDLLAEIDRSFDSLTAEPLTSASRDALVHLVSLRRNLFPDAKGWVATVQVA